MDKTQKISDNHYKVGIVAGAMDGLLIILTKLIIINAVLQKEILQDFKII